MIILQFIIHFLGLITLTDKSSEWAQFTAPLCVYTSDLQSCVLVDGPEDRAVFVSSTRGSHVKSLQLFLQQVQLMKGFSSNSHIGFVGNISDSPNCISPFIHFLLLSPVRGHVTGAYTSSFGPEAGFTLDSGQLLARLTFIHSGQLDSTSQIQE